MDSLTISGSISASNSAVSMPASTSTPASMSLPIVHAIAKHAHPFFVYEVLSRTTNEAWESRERLLETAIHSSIESELRRDEFLRRVLDVLRRHVSTRFDSFWRVGKTDGVSAPLVAVGGKFLSDILVGDVPSVFVKPEVRIRIDADVFTHELSAELIELVSEYPLATYDEYPLARAGPGMRKLIVSLFNTSGGHRYITRRIDIDVAPNDKPITTTDGDVLAGSFYDLRNVFLAHGAFFEHPGTRERLRKAVYYDYSVRGKSGGW